jgi:hypothetical protein
MSLKERERPPDNPIKPHAIATGPRMSAHRGRLGSSRKTGSGSDSLDEINKAILSRRLAIEQPVDELIIFAAEQSFETAPAVGIERTIPARIRLQESRQQSIKLGCASPTAPSQT